MIPLQPSQDLGYQLFATMATFYVPLVVILLLYWRIFMTARTRQVHVPSYFNEVISRWFKVRRNNAQALLRLTLNHPFFARQLHQTAEPDGGQGQAAPVPVQRGQLCRKIYDRRRRSGAAGTPQF